MEKMIEKRKPTLLESLIPLIFMIAIITVGYGMLGLSVEPLIIITAFFSAYCVKRLGYTWEEMEASIFEKIHKSMRPILILWSIGFVIGSWMFSGTVPMIIYYGLQIINPEFLLVTGFVLCALLSTCTGTSWGSASTMGLAIMGIAIGLGVPLAITAGAVVSGSYFGDKLSPLSDSTNIAPLAAGSELYEHIKHMLYTTLPTALVCIVVYTMLGFTISVDPDAAVTSSAIITQLGEMFSFHLLLLVPPIFMIYGSVRKWPALPTMLASSIIATVLGLIFQGQTLKNAFRSLMHGFNVNMTGYEGEIIRDISTLLNRGGVFDAGDTIVLIICAMGFAGIISVAGMLDVIMEELAKKIRSVVGLVSATIVSCITMAIATGSSYLTILIPGELFQNEYKRRNLHPKNLSRTLEDSGTVVVGIVPWSAAGAFMTNALGVPTIEYLPFAIFCYGGIFMALVCAATGFGMAPLDPSKPIVKGEIKD